VVHETGIAELEVQRGDNRVRIRSGAHALDHTITIAPNAASGGFAVPASAPAAEAPAPEEAAGSNNSVVKSPIVGTYYDSPSPGSAPFVKVGEQVEPGKVLCIIESMKLMNEIEAEIAGTVVAKLVENGKPVEYGESLFTIRPR
ncbi:MAG TPA: acetyl-CoA carboxylase biotin carboxyl carrier protein, partial [Bryobacteraceae bacterium]|nr:acetyl-CoA carboxylase biotin carboxyl carrier protein [Bryobacteraceae bacterium]